MIASAWSLSTARIAIESAAILAFAISGLLEAARKQLDAVGLGLFTAGGTQLAVAAGLPAIVAVLMGMITAVFGGVLRDIVCNEIPQAFRDHRPYAVCSFLGGWVVIAADHWQLPGWSGLAAGALLATLLRVLALVFDWRLPPWRTG